MQVITRFAPSPTGYLHIGSARTALFNYLFAKHHNGKFRLRIEDTDKARSTSEAEKEIIEGLNWLGITCDDEIIFQSKRASRHVEVAKMLVEKGRAYYCYSTQEEIEIQRQKAIKEGISFLFESPWRENKGDASKLGVKPVIRLKSPREGSLIINDLVQGQVIVENKILDDMVLLRGDETPTYMLAVVVDDHDMGITHIIRGDDHLNNAFRQKLLYMACDWKVPEMAHIPLIHGPDGAKLSKRHGAVGVEAYSEMGYLPQALCNYLLRLGWSHGDDEIMPKEKAIEWFNLDHVGRAPSRIDFDKMKNINAHYLRELSDDFIISFISDQFALESIELDAESKSNISKALESIKTRSELTVDIINLAKIYHKKWLLEYTLEAINEIKLCTKDQIKETIDLINRLSIITKEEIQASFKTLAASKGLKLNDLMKPIRALLSGQVSSPGVFEIISIIGKESSIERLNNYFKIIA